MTADDPTPADPLASLDAAERATLGAIADRLIPAAHGMPSAAEVLERRPAAVRAERPARPRRAAPGGAPARARRRRRRRASMPSAGTSRRRSAALQLVIVAGYYTDRRVRELIGYPGQMAIELRSWEYPAYLEEGLIDAVLARGPVWRDPATGQRAVAADAPRTYAERWSTDAGSPEGGHDGRDRT